MALKREKPAVLLIITGSIAAPKALALHTLLEQEFEVNIVATASAYKFIHFPDNLKVSSSFLTKDFYDKAESISHINNALNHDLIVVYPATMNFLSKIALAIPESLAVATFLASPKPKIIFPAMNTNMYLNNGLQRNIALLSKDETILVTEPDVGELAEKINNERMIGIGRLKEPMLAYQDIKTFFNKTDELAQKTVLINYGATRTYIDDMRYITNASSGQMGVALIKTLLAKNANVIAVAANNDIPLMYHPNLKLFKVKTNSEMLKIMNLYYDQADLVICVAALNDYKVKTRFKGKISKTKFPNLNLSLKHNIDILKTLGQNKTRQLLIAFSAQDDDSLKTAIAKMKAKNCDGIVVNNIKTIAKSDTNIQFYFNQQVHHLFGSKVEVAREIINIIIPFMH